VQNGNFCRNNRKNLPVSNQFLSDADEYMSLEKANQEENMPKEA